MNYKQCPQCGSTDTTETTLFGKSGLQAYKNRLCRPCGTGWRPASPKWLGLALIALGCVVPWLEFSMAKNSAELNAATAGIGLSSGTQLPTNPSSLAISIGILSAFSGIAVLFGPLRKSKILGKVDPLRK